MLALIIVAACAVVALAFTIAGVRQIFVAVDVVERSANKLGNKPLARQFAATQTRIENVQAEFATLPQLVARARAAFVEIQHHRSRLENAARVVGTASSLIRSIWNGPNRN